MVVTTLILIFNYKMDQYKLHGSQDEVTEPELSSCAVHRKAAAFLSGTVTITKQFIITGCIKYYGKSN